MLRYIFPVIPIIIGFLAGGICPIDREQIPGKGYVPPGWMFATMWSIIYVCIGLFIWQLMCLDYVDPIIWILLIINLAFNFSWSVMYSKKCVGDPTLALWWIFACKLTLLALIVKVLSSNFPGVPSQALWLVLYAVWLDVALLLNYRSLDRK